MAAIRPKASPASSPQSLFEIHIDDVGAERESEPFALGVEMVDDTLRVLDPEFSSAHARPNGPIIHFAFALAPCGLKMNAARQLVRAHNASGRSIQEPDPLVHVLRRLDSQSGELPTGTR